MSENDVTDLARGERGNVDAVPFTKVLEARMTQIVTWGQKSKIYAYRQYKILEGDFNLDPFIIAESWPYKVRFRDGVLVGT